MKVKEVSQSEEELHSLCATIKELVHAGKYQDSKKLIYDAMGTYPHAPEPHNLIGVLLEMEGDHSAAMNHFRAALALDPTYLPARQNLYSFGTFFSIGKYIFDTSDCSEDESVESVTEYDEHGTGHVRR